MVVLKRDGFIKSASFFYAPRIYFVFCHLFDLYALTASSQNIIEPFSGCFLTVSAFACKFLASASSATFNASFQEIVEPFFGCTSLLEGLLFR